MSQEPPELPSEDIPPTTNSDSESAESADDALTDWWEDVPSPVSPEAMPPEPVTPADAPEWLAEAGPVFKAGIVRILRSLIQTLETWVAKLEAEPTTPTVAQPGTVAPDAVSLPSLPIDQWREQLQGGWQRVLAWWLEVLVQVRGRLPAAVNRQLADDRALTGALAGVVGVILVVLTSLLPGKQPAPQVAAVPSPQPSPTQTLPPDLSAPTPPVVIAPSPEASPTPTPTPIASPTPTPSPTPALKRTPEQTLIASIQDQVAEVTEKYANGLIQSIQANFQNSRLIVRVGENWYELPAGRQNKLADEMLSRAQQLDFSKLEITDTQGALIARSPVVGSTMVILQRKPV